MHCLRALFVSCYPLTNYHCYHIACCVRVLAITIEGDSEVMRACSLRSKIMMEDASLIGSVCTSEGNPLADVWIPLLVTNQRATNAYLAGDTT